MFGSKKPAENGEDKNKNILPLLPLRDIIVFPHMVVPLFVGRAKSIRALEEAVKSEKDILLAAQINSKTNDPMPNDIYNVGTMAAIIKLHNLPDSTVKVLLEGKRRARINKFLKIEDYFLCEVKELIEEEEVTPETKALMRSVNSTFDTYVKLDRKIPPEVLVSVTSISEPSRLADTIVAHLNLKLDDKQKILEIESSTKRLEQLFSFMQGQIEILMVERKVRTRVKKQMDGQQKEYWLKEQLRAIHKELGMDYGIEIMSEPVFKRLVELFKIGSLNLTKLEKYIVLERERKIAADSLDLSDRDVLTLDQAAVYLKVSNDDIIHLIQEEELPGKKIGEEWRFSRRAILEWLERKDK